MKRLKNYLLSLIAIAGFVACSDDDPGLAPVVNGGDVNIELKRDTADVYKISVPITSEEGLAKVSLVDNASGSALNEVTSFSNPNDYTYNYDFDLIPYTENTVIMLTLKIEDKEGQVVSKKITLTVKKFSELDVRFATEGTIVSQFEDCNLKVTVERGMLALKEVKVYVGETLAESFDLSLDAEQSKYVLNVLVKGLEMGENTVNVIVIDEKNQEFAKDIKVERIKSKTWSDLYVAMYDPKPAWQGMMATEISFNDEKPGDIENLDVLSRIAIYPAMSNGTTADFVYDGDKIVKMTLATVNSGEGSFDVLSVDAVYEYKYNADGELVKVIYTDADDATRDYITDVVYESGNIKSYKIDGKEYTPTYLEKNGTLVRVDLLDEDLSGKTYGFAEGKDMQPNPLYVAGLPAVVPGAIAGIDLNKFYNRYLFDTLNDGNTVLVEYDVQPISENVQNVTWNQDGDDMEMKFVFAK